MWCSWLDPRTNSNHKVSRKNIFFCFYSPHSLCFWLIQYDYKIINMILLWLLLLLNILNITVIRLLFCKRQVILFYSKVTSRFYFDRLSLKELYVNLHMCSLRCLRSAWFNEPRHSKTLKHCHDIVFFSFFFFTILLFSLISLF